jgi:hypothetical protein
MTGTVAIANPALVKKIAMAKTPAARLRKDCLRGVEETAPRRKSAVDMAFLE